MNENEKSKTGYLEFLDLIADCVIKTYNGRIKVEKSTSDKNNGVRMTGLMIKTEGDSIAPNFYLEQQYFEWQSGKKDLYEIVTWLCHAYEEERSKNGNLAERIRLEWESIAPSVFLRLINREKNEELLKEVPYEEFMDLALIYYYSIDLPDEIQGTMTITKRHMELFKISQEELRRTALENTKQLCPVKLYKMDELVFRLGERLGIPVCELTRAFEGKLFHMYVLSNQRGKFGAVAMTFPEVLEEFAAKLGKSFYVLPSSIHEVIFVPDSEGFSPEGFAKIVCEVNETQVEAVDFLSDSVYFFDYKDKRMKRVR